MKILIVISDTVGNSNTIFVLGLNGFGKFPTILIEVGITSVAGSIDSADSDGGSQN